MIERFFSPLNEMEALAAISATFALLLLISMDRALMKDI
jgi:hypothetical protein